MQNYVSLVKHEAIKQPMKTFWWIELLKQERIYLPPEIMNLPYLKYREELLEEMAMPVFRQWFEEPLVFMPLKEPRKEDLIFQKYIELVKDRIIRGVK